MRMRSSDRYGSPYGGYIGAPPSNLRLRIPSGAGVEGGQADPCACYEYLASRAEGSRALA
jgi:hypothetical protein